MTPSYTPPWPQSRVPKHPPDETHLSGVYCLAAAAWWLLRDDDQHPTPKAILKTMKATLPPSVARTGLVKRARNLCAGCFAKASQVAVDRRQQEALSHARLTF
jgi:hypothetical protein